MLKLRLIPIRRCILPNGPKLYQSMGALASSKCNDFNSIDHDPPLAESHDHTPTSSAVSRQAAHIIRKAVASGSPGMAFRVLNGIYRHSVQLQEGKLPNDVELRSSVPRRLTTTAMVHALLRAGKPLKAAQVAEIAWVGRDKRGVGIGGGMNLSHKTSDAIIAALCRPSSLLPTGLQPWEIFSDAKASSHQDPRDPFSETHPESEDPAGFAQHVQWMEGLVNRQTAINPRAQSLSFFSPRNMNTSTQTTFSLPNPISPPPSSPRTSRTDSRLDYSTQRAILFVRVARYARQKRTTQMYKRIIDACLVQGEVIVGTLLFVLLVRDWQARRMIKAAETELGRADAEVDAGDMGDSGGELHASWANRSNLDQPIDLESFPNDLLSGLSRRRAEHMALHTIDLPYPSPTIIPSILDALNLPIDTSDQNPRRIFLTRTSRRAQLASSRADPGQSAESLSHLFHLLREKSLPEIDGHLIRTLADLPEGFPHTVGPKSPLLADEVFDSHQHSGSLVGTDPLKKGTPLQVAAHEALRSLTSQPYLEPPEGESPLLSMRAYTELLSFCLRQSQTNSLGSAKTVLSAMAHAGLEANEHTDRILLRTATLQRLEGMAKESLDSIVSDLEAKRELGRGVDLRVLLLIYAVRARWNPEDSLSSLKFSELREEMKDQVERGVFFWGHSALLHTVIQYLVSNGHADLVVQDLSLIIPPLESNHSDSLDVAASYGPSLYIAIFNAIAKLPCRNTGCAERMWYLMKAAERQSWWIFLRHVYRQRSGLDGEGTQVPVWPWLMSVHGYTLMMKIYVREGKSGVRRVEGGVFRPEKMYTKGWGSSPLDYDDSDSGCDASDGNPSLRSEMARHRALKIHHRLLSLPSRVPQILQGMWNKLEDAHGLLPDQAATKGIDLWDLKTPTYPTPNAAYFNEALDLWGRVDGSRMRKSIDRLRTRQRTSSNRKSISRSKGHQTQTIAVVDKLEKPNLEGNLYFEMLKKDVEDFGFELPLAFRQEVDGMREDGDHRVVGPEGPFKIPWKRPAGDERDCIVHPNSPPWRWVSQQGN